MKLNVKAGVLLFFVSALVAPASVLSQQADIQQLVDELQSVTKKARQERAADRWLQLALEDLIAKYNNLWRNSLLLDDFSDGDFQQNPAWQVASGQFWVDRRLGLRSQVSEQPVEQNNSQPEAAPQKKDIGKALLGALLQEALGPERNQPQTQQAEPTAIQAAAIRSAIDIPTSFALNVSFSQNNRPGVHGQYEWVVMQSEAADNAYKVVITTGAKALLEVIRIRSGRDAYLDSVSLPALNDGGEHRLSWRQTAAGEIDILLDDASVLKTSDRPFRYGFKYLAMINRSGDFSVSQIELLGGQ